MKLLLRAGILLLALAALSGCQKMGSAEYGVRFRKLPPFLGGGVANDLVSPGSQTMVMPWESIYRFDTSLQQVSWGAPSHDQRDDLHQDFVYTRAHDGNELALSFTIQFNIEASPEKIRTLVQDVVTSNHEVAEMVIAVGRSEIRKVMNKLNTSAFLGAERVNGAITELRSEMAKSLDQYGINIVKIILHNYRFERKLSDGSVDSSYQDRLTEIQRLTEDTVRAESSVQAIQARMEQDVIAMQVLRQQLEAEANGYRNQTKLRGDAHFEARSNEAKGIQAKGESEVKGIIEQINALSGPGGNAILKLEIARQLKSSDARFVLLGEEKGGNGLEIRKLDTNALLSQAGLIEGMKDEKRESKNQEE